MTFGEKLRNLRVKKKLTQETVATAVGVSRRTYISYEKDNIRPRKDETYQKLADVLECDVNYLKLEDSLLNNVSDTLKSILPVGTAGVTAFTLLSPLGLGSSLVGAVIASSLAQKMSEEITEKMSEEITEEITEKMSEEITEEIPVDNVSVLIQYEKSQKRFAAISLGLLYQAAAKKGILCHPDINNKQNYFNGIVEEEIVVSNQEITHWWLLFYSTQDLNSGVPLDVQAIELIKRVIFVNEDPKRMASIVVDDPKLFESISSYKEKNSYKGNLSAILVDTNEVKILKEEEISSYYGNDSDKIFLSVL